MQDDTAPSQHSLVIVEDDLGDAASDQAREILVNNAEAADVRAITIEHTHDSDIVRYATLLQKGSFTAAYLAIGGGRSAP